MFSDSSLHSDIGNISPGEGEVHGQGISDSKCTARYEAAGQIGKELEIVRLE